MGISHTLRPLRTGEMLDRALRLYRNHFLLFSGIVALAIGPMTVLELLSQMVIGDAAIIS